MKLCYSLKLNIDKQTNAKTPDIKEKNVKILKESIEINYTLVNSF